MRLLSFCFFIASIVQVTPYVCAQSDVAAEPIVGLRDNRPNDFALTGARVVVRPGQVLAEATVLVQDTSIVAVGKEVKVPEGFMAIDCRGRTIYAGLIDAFSEADVPPPPAKSAGHWNPQITPQRRASETAAASVGDAKKLRSQGFTVRVVAPKAGIVKGTSAVVLLGETESGRTLLKEKVWQHVLLTVPRDKSRSSYPNSPMGAVALLRQSLHDANWYRDAWRAYEASTHLPRPETNTALAALAHAISEDTFLADASNERMALRAHGIASEFSIKMVLRGSGREYRDLTAISAIGKAMLIPVDFPEKPSVATAIEARDQSLRDLLHWDLAPENPARLANAGVTFCLTTDGLENVSDFLRHTRTAIDRGLTSDQALAALTTTPARLLGIDSVVGRVQQGMLANLVITDGDLFAEETKVLETWVAGKQFEVASVDAVDEDALVGKWNLQFAMNDKPFQGALVVRQEGSKLSAEFVIPKAASEADRNSEAKEQIDNGENESSASDEDTNDRDRAHSEEAETTSVKLESIVRQSDRLTASVSLSELDPEIASGISQLTLATVDEGDEATTLFGTIRLPSGETRTLELEFVKPEFEQDPISDDSGVVETDDEAENAVAADDFTTPLLYPLGAYGLEHTIRETPTVLFRGATVWTCDEAGVIENGEVLIQNGKIVAVGENLETPAVCHVYDASGKHITPGLIDCHSHMGTDGGVNESGQSVTAEVRIGDFIDNTDMNIYRQLAGGLTIANILHGSANPIGGQNQVIKLRWGQSMDGLRMTEAPAGIKFALGENVKRNTSRYPNTRMGVEQIIRDQLLAAREYDAAWRDWRSGDRSGLPPRRDLQLDAMAEIQRGERWIHCHSYRQDEIVATLDVLEEFGVQIGTLQHILEGYKVADRMARHGAMASSFSDWWAYKFEVFDAIPYNGALMHEQGVVVSFNSDDRELARHLNTEAAKAVKYGGVDPHEALKFVTLNPAKQLRIADQVGSLVAGKHADLVVWSGPPLSTTTRCVQTWIDGCRYFDLKTDKEMRLRDARLHARLVQKVLSDSTESVGKTGKSSEKVEEEDRWARHDVFCGAHGADGHVHTNWERQR